MPAPATTKVAVVEILKVPNASPPVPHISIAGKSRGTVTIMSRIAWANPVISSTVSPFARSAIRKPAICGSSNSPDIIEDITLNASSRVRFCLSSICSNICFIVLSLKNSLLFVFHSLWQSIQGGTEPRKPDEFHVRSP